MGDFQGFMKTSIITHDGSVCMPWSWSHLPSIFAPVMLAFGYHERLDPSWVMGHHRDKSMGENPWEPEKRLVATLRVLFSRFRVDFDGEKSSCKAQHMAGSRCYLVGGFSPPLWKIWVSQLGWWHSQYQWVNKKMATKPPTSYFWILLGIGCVQQNHRISQELRCEPWCWNIDLHDLHLPSFLG